MAAIKRFEDIKAWQMARELTRKVYRISGEGTFSRDFSLRDQLRRASVSTMANIAEGFERSGDREFLHFLSTAKASAGEVRSHLYVALDAGHISAGEFEQLYSLAAETGQIIGGFMSYLTQSEFKGAKFK